jgi:hypothetical protein
VAAAAAAASSSSSRPQAAGSRHRSRHRAGASGQRVRIDRAGAPEQISLNPPLAWQQFASLLRPAPSHHQLTAMPFWDKARSQAGAFKGKGKGRAPCGCSRNPACTGSALSQWLGPS